MNLLLLLITSTKIDILDVQAIVCIDVGNIAWSQHSHMSSQHNKNMTTLTLLLHILIMSNFHISYVCR